MRRSSIERMDSISVPVARKAGSSEQNSPAGLKTRRYETCCAEENALLGASRVRWLPMWNWFTRWGTITRQTADQMTITVRPTPAVSGKYARLYTYLENRYADVIVLTFGQIEDVIGFALPTLANSPAWWTSGETNADGARHSDAWLVAGRTATPNLKARTVAFERKSTVRPGRRSS